MQLFITVKSCEKPAVHCCIWLFGECPQQLTALHSKEPGMHQVLTLLIQTYMHACMHAHTHTHTNTSTDGPQWAWTAIACTRWCVHLSPCLQHCHFTTEYFQSNMNMSALRRNRPSLRSGPFLFLAMLGVSYTVESRLISSRCGALGRCEPAKGYANEYQALSGQHYCDASLIIKLICTMKAC